jgi:SPP1 gp7 family putative phage head morphogenesis protein
VCDVCSRLETIVAARRAADELLDGFRQPVTKADSLGTPTGFDRAVAVLAADLRASVRGAETEAVRRAVGVLDVDWRSSTPSERRRVVRTALREAGRALGNVPTTIETTLGRTADAVFRATRGDLRAAQRLVVGADLNALDRRMVDHVVRTQTNFVRDAAGRRLEAFSATARATVASGLDRGLGRDDIAAELAEAARAQLLTRSGPYWEVVAGAFVGNARSFGQLSGFAEAGIQRYRIEAVMDERTTEICRYLDGKVFEVGDALRRFDRIDRFGRPEEIRREQPWVRTSTDPATGQRSMFVDRDGQRVRIGDVVRSAVGTSDDVGEFARTVSNAELMDLGVSWPPYHGLCRSTCLAVV